MKAKFTDEQLKAGTRIKGNVNGAIFEILWVDENEKGIKYAMLKDEKTERKSLAHLETLKRYDLTIL